MKIFLWLLWKCKICWPIVFGEFESKLCSFTILSYFWVQWVFWFRLLYILWGKFSANLILTFYIKFVGKRWKFVPKRFLSPPREFKRLYGNELRQTTLENFFKNEKNNKNKWSLEINLLVKKCCFIFQTWMMFILVLISIWEDFIIFKDGTGI